MSDISPSSSTAETMKRLSSGVNISEQISSNVVQPDDKVLKMATFSLQKYLKEPDFAAEFLERGGLESLCEIIKKASGNTLAYALNSFASLMEHNTGWDSLSEDFVVEIAHIVVNETLVTIGRPATAILIKIVTANNHTDDEMGRPSTTVTTDLNSKATTGGEKVSSDPTTESSESGKKKTAFGYPTLQKAIEHEPQLLSTLIQRLQSQDYTLCLNSLALLTAMLKTVTEEHQSELPERLGQLNIGKYIVRLMNSHPSDELRKHLLEYQTAMIRNVIQRRRTPVSLHNSKDMKMLNEIWDAAKVANIQVPGARKWKKIGFSSESPQREFTRTGKFGLQRMHAFVVGNQDLFAKMLLEEIHRPENKRCLFARTSCESTELLFSQWDISSGYIAAELDPILMYFDRVQASTIRLFFRLFQDMKATNADFSKVSALVRSQLRAVFRSDTVKDIGEFERVIDGTPYQVIRDRRLKELEWADDLLGREAIRNLRSRLNKQSYDFIKQQRISCLLQGAWFPNSLQRSGSTSTPSGTMATNELIGNVGSSGGGSSGKRWRYYKLSPSKKALQFGDFSERVAPIIKDYDKLPNKIDLSQVFEIRTIRKRSNAGAMALFPLPPSSTPMSPTSPVGFGSHPFASSSSGSNYLQHDTASSTSALAFALYNENHTSLAEFICATSEQASEWKDGFSMLLDKGITSKETAEYLHSLTEIGVKVKLLQIAGDRVEVPHGSLEVPPIPYGSASRFYYDV
ncbi:ELMO/CED-12 family-domain-containing protein [Halteromyces radiatus]|uniref:ELMO/CED-12 family-domain-containing protein n=1 Tax=Halteromyces radiatus TaxID=101107 RepID=UPI00221FBAC7|nr:ELMO/CED-12 family-domain-containing protein [Halteromyces radiatus]KAI8093144.1 ELMO/CED-12 family-domain-containing protein [Halteromyces radiatus]